MGELFYVLLTIAVGVICYFLGRSDGYWKRAAEDRARLADQPWPRA